MAAFASLTHGDQRVKILESLKLFGRNRRCKATAIELWLQLTCDEAPLPRKEAMQ